MSRPSPYLGAVPAIEFVLATRQCVGEVLDGHVSIESERLRDFERHQARQDAALEEVNLAARRALVATLECERTMQGNILDKEGSSAVDSALASVGGMLTSITSYWAEQETTANAKQASSLASTEQRIQEYREAIEMKRQAVEEHYQKERMQIRHQWDSWGPALLDAHRAAAHSSGNVTNISVHR
eukprot:TRINITY_DN16279_c0_g1_i1.p1 TRINITY_DN16279_c0_g1~~TRINITY_DN16279_c0_g1_i1.p1  ORF type:complete len:185 (+),score=34.18 TRINITY_DN16279_c0_g1_i1:46-600(+)